MKKQENLLLHRDSDSVQYGESEKLMRNCDESGNMVRFGRSAAESKETENNERKEIDYV
jgi:hypothetical protein